MRLFPLCRWHMSTGLVVLKIVSGASLASAQVGGRIEIVPDVPHAGAIASMAFSADGTQAVSGSMDKTLKLGDVASGRLMRTFVGHSDTVTTVSFSSDGIHLVSSSSQDTALWDIASGQLIRAGKFAPRAKSVAFSRDANGEIRPVPSAATLPGCVEKLMSVLTPDSTAPSPRPISADRVPIARLRLRSNGLLRHASRKMTFV